jgi:hypothetical protein
MYSNPGAWAALLGVDIVRNNKAKGIDYATMHVYVDQWLCVAEGSTRDGQLDFMRCVFMPAERRITPPSSGPPIHLLPSL